MTKKLAILDDYQGVALQLADWLPLQDAVDITVFREHLGDEDQVAAALRDFEILCVMRERTELVNGEFNIRSSEGDGTCITVIVPLMEASVERLHQPGSAQDIQGT